MDKISGEGDEAAGWLVDWLLQGRREGGGGLMGGRFEGNACREGEGVP